MSVWYFLQVDIEAQYSEENIIYILTKCTEYGFVYLAQEEGIDICFLDIQQASAKVLAATEEMRLMCEDTLSVKYKDTFFDLRFFKRDHNLISLSIYSFSCPWTKDFWYGREESVIDFARYTDLIFSVTDHLLLSYFKAFADDLKELISSKEKNCVTAVISLGLFADLLSESEERAKDNVARIIRNGVQNGFIFFDEKMEDGIEPSVQRCYDALKAEFPVYLYAKVDNVPFKIEIKRNERAYDFVSIYPLKPYRMKKGHGSEEEKIDLAFYVKRLIELCENFAIYELKTFL